MYDVVIIGAGIVGAMTARELAKYRLRICVLEQENDVACGATKANSAIVHAGFDAKPGTLKARLNVRGSQMMEKVAKDLGVHYQRNGSLVIGFSEEDRRTIERLLSQGKDNGVEGLRILDSAELHKLEPGLSPKASCALYAPTGAIVCPYMLCIAAIGNAMDQGVELKRNFKVSGLEISEDAVRVSSDTETVTARYVINAAGLYADQIAALAGDTSFQIHPRRGEYLLLDQECGALSKHTIFRTPTEKGKGILLSPTVDGNYLAGPTAVDQVDKTDKSTTQDGLFKVMEEAAENLPTISFRKTITSFCGLRAVGDTGDFILRPYRNRLIHAAGIESPGLSASPAIAEYLVGLLRECGAELLENPEFSPIRKPNYAFREADIETKNQIIRENPAYGRIICRCEKVTEGEIIDAIRQNPGARDIDGIKRRTRAGMGRCQSGFCLPYTAEILARELKVPLEQITKFGGKSYLISGKEER